MEHYLYVGLCEITKLLILLHAYYFLLSGSKNGLQKAFYACDKIINGSNLSEYIKSCFFLPTITDQVVWHNCGIEQVQAFVII